MDNVVVELLICSRWYYEERKKRKNVTGTVIWVGYDLVDVTVVYGFNSLFFFLYWEIVKMQVVLFPHYLPTCSDEGNKGY